MISVRIRGLASVFILTFLVFLNPVSSAFAEREWIAAVGDGAPYAAIADALDAIPLNAGHVRIRIAPTIEASLRDAVLTIPQTAGLTRVTFEADPTLGSRTPWRVKTRLLANRSVRVGSVYHVYANGIPLRIGPGLIFPNGSVFGGSKAELHDLATVHSTEVSIAGEVADVYGGGYAKDGGKSIVRGDTSVLIEATGAVYWKVCGGGFAEGAEAYATASDTSVRIHGETAYVFGGGAAGAGGSADVIGVSRVALAPEGRSTVALFGGGTASEEGSEVRTTDSEVIIYGSAEWVFGGDYAFARGAAALSGLALIVIDPAASVSELYAGSFATDRGSFVEIARARVEGANSAAFYSDRSVASRDAEADDPAIER